MARDLAIDLGTASVLVYRLGDGIVFDDATVVALDAATNRVVAVGDPVDDVVRLGGLVEELGDPGGLVLRHGPPKTRLAPE